MVWASFICRLVIWSGRGEPRQPLNGRQGVVPLVNESRQDSNVIIVLPKLVDVVELIVVRLETYYGSNLVWR